jgi:hypothetical protein
MHNFYKPVTIELRSLFQGVQGKEKDLAPIWANDRRYCLTIAYTKIF